MLISSLIAACGHPPVSTARILSSGNAPCFIKNSPSSFVNISFVTYKEMHLNMDINSFYILEQKREDFKIIDLESDERASEFQNTKYMLAHNVFPVKLTNVK